MVLANHSISVMFKDPEIQHGVSGCLGIGKRDHHRLILHGRSVRNVDIAVWWVFESTR